MAKSGGGDSPAVRQSSFGKGEIAPALYGRSDWAGYYTALKRCRNVLIDQHGAALNRPGTKFVAQAAGSDKVRLIPFVYSNSTAFVLEFSAGHIRFYQNGYQVKVSGSPVDVSSPYAAVDLPQLKYAQQGAVLTITHPNYAPRDLRLLVVDGTSWSLTATPIGYAPTPARWMGFTNWVAGWAADGKPKSWSYAVTALYTDGSESLPLAMREVLVDRVQYAPSFKWWYYGSNRPVGFNIYLGRGGVWGFLDYVPMGDNYTSSGGGSGFATYTDSTLPSDLAAPMGNKGALPCGSNVANAPNFNSGPRQATNPFPGSTLAYALLTYYAPGQRVYVNGNTYEITTPGLTAGTGSGPAGTSGTFQDGPAYRAANTGYALGATAIIDGGLWQCIIAGTTSTNSYVSTTSGSPGTFTDGTVTWNWIAFGDRAVWKFVQVGQAQPQWPACVTYFDQRRVYGNIPLSPSRIVGSVSGDYNNFDVQLNPGSSDAVTFDLASRYFEEIRGFLPTWGLLALCSQSEWSVNSAQGSSNPITPSSIAARAQSYRGSSWLDPLLVGNLALFVQATGTEVRELVFNFFSNTFQGDCVSVQSAHLLENHTVVDWAYAQNPYSIIWSVREDGKLLGFTYLKEQEVAAWHWHDTGPLDVNGNATHHFESICTIPEGSETAVYVVVGRVINGTYTRYVERFASRRIPRLPTGQVDVQAGVFLDAAITYVATGAMYAFSSLGHLAGQQVMVLGDGSVYGPYTVSPTGTIDITADCPDGVLRATVGLPYLSQVDLLPIYINSAQSIRSNVKNVFRVSFEVADSRGMWVGNTYSTMQEWNQRDVSDGYVAIQPTTGLDHVRLPGTWEHDGSVRLEQRDPLPMTLLAVEREFELGGD